ncbi:MAG: D-alanyl-D-alanine carboxypeptidase [Proteobacteria bacterium]|nr:D-alanyl-D-alanine carboxypeptidase [Pseudomonadota bacterium]
MRKHAVALLFALLLICGHVLASVAIADNYSPLYAGLVMDRQSGRVLYQHSADETRRPASLTKMMTLHLLFDALRGGKVSMHTQLPISSYAARQPRSNLNLRPGSKISVRDSIHALIIHSANDVAVVVAEALGGNEDNFVQMMNRKAAALGMESTRFANPHGLHDDSQVSTARDMARLATALHKNHPKYIPLFSKKSFTYKGRVIHTHNRVINRFSGANGMKTGYIKASGFNVVTTTHRHDGDLVAVVMGGDTAKARDDHMIELLSKSYVRLAENKGVRTDRKLDGQYRSMFAAVDPAVYNAGKPSKITAEGDASGGEEDGLEINRSNVFAPIEKQKIAAISARVLEDSEEVEEVVQKKQVNKPDLTVAKKAKVSKVSSHQAKVKKKISVAKHRLKNRKVLASKSAGLSSQRRLGSKKNG